MTRKQRLVFGEVAATYDRVRPGYPDVLIDRVIVFARAGVSADDSRPLKVLDVGAGTGKATFAFAVRGHQVVALEPSAEMAGVLRGRAEAEQREIVIVEDEFERWRPDQPADLVVAAQAWHWLDPASRLDLVHAALVPGGTLALLVNTPREEGGELRPAIDEIYDRYATHFVHGVLPAKGPGSKGVGLDAPIEQIEADERFGPVTHDSQTWEQTRTCDEYLDLLSTQSDHRMLAPVVLEALLGELREVVDASGGSVTTVYDTNAHLVTIR